MRHKMREYIAEIWAAFINLVSIVVLVLINKYTNVPTEVELVSGLTIISLTLVLFIFKQSILTNIEEKLEVYKRLEAIDDPDMREQGKIYVNELNAKLDELSRGLLIGSTPDLIRFLSDKVEGAKSSVKATLLLETPEQLYKWQYPPANYYYEINKKVVSKGKEFVRIFLLRKESFVRENIFDPKAEEIILGQVKDGIDVYIAWLDEITDPESRQDFVIVDSELVYINDTGAISTGGWRTRISKSSHEVANYQRKFSIIRTYSSRPEIVIASLLSTGLNDES